MGVSWGCSFLKLGVRVELGLPSSSKGEGHRECSSSKKGVLEAQHSLGGSDVWETSWVFSRSIGFLVLNPSVGLMCLAPTKHQALPGPLMCHLT